MYKAFALIGFAAFLFLSQGCGGKKQIAAVPPSQPASNPTPMAGAGTSIDPDMAASGKGGEGSSMESESGMGGYSGGGPKSGNSSMESESGMGGYSGGGPQSGGSPMGNSPMQGYGGGNPMGLSGSGDGFQPDYGAQYGQQPGNNNGNTRGAPAGGRNQNRPAPKPLTLKEQSIVAFQSGNPKRAYALMQAHALQVEDEEAMEVLKEYRWAAHRKRPQLGLNVAVGVTLKNNSNSSDLSPIGSDLRNAGGGGGGMEYGGGMGAAPGMGGAAANSKSKSFAETTGAFGASLASAFKESHSKGLWSPAFKEVSLSTGRNSGFGGAAPGFGGGFAGGGFAGGDGNDSGSGFQENGNQFDGGNQNNGNQSTGYPPGYGQQMQQSGSGGGDAYGNMGGGSPAMPTGLGPASSGDLSGAGPTGKGGAGSSPLKFLQGQGGFGAGGLEEGGFGGQPGYGGPGAQGGGRNPVLGANSKLPAGSTPIAPCLIFIGVDEPAKLIKKAAQEGYDALIIFDVKVGLNRVLGKITNDTFVSVVQPNLVPKEVKRIYSSKVLNNLQAAKSTAKGDSDGVDEVIERIMKGTEEALALQAIPTVLTSEMIVNKRIPALVKETESTVIERLSEVNLYYSKGLIDDSQKAAAFEQIDGSAGKLIATGSPSEKLAALEKLIEREFK